MWVLVTSSAKTREETDMMWVKMKVHKQRERRSWKTHSKRMTVGCGAPPDAVSTVADSREGHGDELLPRLSPVNSRVAHLSREASLSPHSILLPSLACSRQDLTGGFIG